MPEDRFSQGSASRPSARPPPAARSGPGREPGVRYAGRASLSFAFVWALQQLPPRQRAALLLHDVCGFTGPEVAVMLETSVLSVACMVERARVLLDACQAAPGVSPIQ